MNGAASLHRFVKYSRLILHKWLSAIPKHLNRQKAELKRLPGSPFPHFDHFQTSNIFHSPRERQKALLEQPALDVFQTVIPIYKTSLLPAASQLSMVNFPIILPLFIHPVLQKVRSKSGRL